MYYKSFDKVYLGISDIASLVARTCSGVFNLCFGGDGDYRAYECFGDVEIGEHYKKVFEADTWLKIYDDERLTYYRYRPEEYSKCDIYRAGDYGCILHWHN